MKDFMKKAFRVYDKEWALVTAGNMEKFISCVNSAKFASYDISRYKLESTLNDNVNLYLGVINGKKELQSI